MTRELRQAPSACLAGTVVALLAASGCSVPVSSDAPPSSPPPLHHTYGSPEEVAAAMLEHLAGGDVEALEELALSELEFRTVVWPELPASRPDRGLPFDYVWGDLHQKSTNELRRLIDKEGGRRYELVSIEFDGASTPYEAFTVHRESRLAVRDAAGTEHDLRLFGSILQRGDEYKLFSYVVD